MKIQAATKVEALLVFLILILYQSMAFAQMNKEDFEITLKACATNKSIPTSPDLLVKISALYGDDSTKNAINEIGRFLSLLPEADRAAAYGLYQQCIVDILSRMQSQKPETATNLSTVTFKVCSGEYARACRQHDVHLYCYADVKTWAIARCTASTVSRYETYGGNKCGYSMDLVTCTGPK